MQTQIQCPQCGTPFPTEVHQLVDAQRTPHLKEMLLGGALNVAQCPNCGMATRLASPLMYHDKEHEMLIVHVPMELNWSMHEQEQQIGRMAKAITDSLPPEEFKAYLLQPKTIITMETFMEQVYSTEGITPEMIQRQRDQAQLLQQLVTGDKLTQISLINEKKDLIDQTFFAMLQSNLQMLEQNPAPEANQQFILLTNLQARLFTMTEVGKELEQQQVALAGFQQAVKTQGGLTYDLFLDQLIANDGNEAVQSSIMQMGYQAIQYELFTILTNRIDAAEGEEAAKLTDLRERLLKIYDQLQEQAKVEMGKAKETLDALIAAPSPEQGVQENMGRIDEGFMHYLSAQVEMATQAENQDLLDKLKPIYALIMAAAESQLPPEVQFINALMQTEDEAQMQEMLGQIPAEAKPQIKQMLASVQERAAAENPDMAAKIGQALNML